MLTLRKSYKLFPESSPNLEISAFIYKIETAEEAIFQTRAVLLRTQNNAS